MRIVSLLPGATEFVAALDLTRQLVGRSHECDLPEVVRSLPALTAPRLAMDGASTTIHATVAAALRDGAGLYRIDARELNALAPDVIVTQDQCEVCAVSLAEVRAAVAPRRARDVRVVSLDPHRLDDVIEDATRIAAACDVPERGRALAARMRAELAAVEARVRGLPRRRVAVLEWLDPPMTSGSWIPELTRIAGGEEALGRSGEKSRCVTIADLAAAEVETLIMAPCGFDLERTRREWSLVRARFASEWRSPSTVFAIDGNRHLNRPGPRIAQGAALIAAAIHPELVHIDTDRLALDRLNAGRK